MKLSPKVLRIIAEAIRAFPDAAARDLWRDWAERSDPGDLPANVAEVALKALEFTDRYIAESLVSERLDRDEQADLANDQALMHAIERDIRRELRG